MNTNMTGFILDGFQKSLRPCALDESSLSIGRMKKINEVEMLITSIPTSLLQMI